MGLSSLLPIFPFSSFFISSFRFTSFILSSLFPIHPFSFFIHFLLSFYSIGSLLSVSNSRFSFFFTSSFRFIFESLFFVSNSPFYFFLYFLLSFHFLRSLFSVSNSPFLFLPPFLSFVLLSWVSLTCFQFPFLFLLHFPFSFYFLGLSSLFTIPPSLSSFISSFRFTSLGLSSLFPVLPFSFFLQFLLSFLPSNIYIC